MNRISCENARRQMPLYLSAELTGDPLGEFSNHLAGCAGCFSEAERQMDLDRELREAVLGERCAPDETVVRIREHIRKEYWRRWIVAGLGTAVAALVVGALFASARMVGPMEAAAKDHNMEVTEKQPRQWSIGNDITGLAVSAGIPISLPDLTKDGFALDRGRLCILEGKMWLHLVYRGRTHEISLFLHPDNGHGQNRMVTVGDAAVGAFTFAGVNASLITDSRDECLSIANELRLGAL